MNGNYVEERAVATIDRHRPGPCEPNHMSPDGAQRLAARLREFWGTDSGVIVTVMPSYPYGIRSNLVNGLPPRGHWISPKEARAQPARHR